MQRIAIGIITITILVLLGIFVLPKFFGTEEKMSVPESSRELPAGLARQPTLIPDVPFTPQAPLGNWEDERQQAGCEEAAALMATFKRMPMSVLRFVRYGYCGVFGF